MLNVSVKIVIFSQNHDSMHFFLIASNINHLLNISKNDIFPRTMSSNKTSAKKSKRQSIL